MTSSKSDLEAKEGQIPNESNFLEFISLLGSLSTRGCGASTQEVEGVEANQEAGAAKEGTRILNLKYHFKSVRKCWPERRDQEHGSVPTDS